MNVIKAKIESIEHCVVRVHEEYAGDPANLINPTRQDALVLNLCRACQLSVDLALYLVVKKEWLDAQKSATLTKESFQILFERGVIGADIMKRMEKIVDFKKELIHNSEAIDKKELQIFVEKHLGDFSHFTRELQQYLYL